MSETRAAYLLNGRLDPRLSKVPFSSDVLPAETQHYGVRLDAGQPSALSLQNCCLSLSSFPTAAEPGLPAKGSRSGRRCPALGSSLSNSWACFALLCSGWWWKPRSQGIAPFPVISRGDPQGWKRNRYRATPEKEIARGAWEGWVSPRWGGKEPDPEALEGEGMPSWASFCGSEVPWNVKEKVGCLVSEFRGLRAECPLQWALFWVARETRPVHWAWPLSFISEGIYLQSINRIFYINYIYIVVFWDYVDLDFLQMSHGF